MKKAVLCFLIMLCAAVMVRAAWTDIDGFGLESVNISDEDGNSMVPDIKIDSRGYAHVVWYEDYGGNLEIHYLKYNGSGWTDADGNGRESEIISNTPGLSEYPKMVLDAFDRPNIVWQEETGANKEIYLLKWNGSQWVDADGTGTGSVNISNTVKNSMHPDIALGPMGRVYVSWQEGDEEFGTPSPAQICMLMFNGASWVDADGAGTGSMVVRSGSYPQLWSSICVDNTGRPYVAWSDGSDTNREIYMQSFTAGAWSNVGPSVNISNSTGYSSWPTMALDSAQHPVMAFEDDSTGLQDIYLLKWNGTSWTDIDGTGTESVDITNSYHVSSAPRLKLDASDMPHITYGEGSFESGEVYCIKWNGSSWSDESGSGYAERSASDAFYSSAWPCNAIGPDGSVYVVWSSGWFVDNHEIYLKRYMHAGTPTVTPTITPTHTFDINETASLTHTVTKTITATRTLTATRTITQTYIPNVTPTATFDICWADVNAVGRDSQLIGAGHSPALDISSSGQAYTAWQNGTDVYASYPSGSGWAYDLVSWNSSQSYEPTVAADNGFPWVAWCGGFYTGWQKVFLLRRTAGVWTDADGVNQESMTVPVPSGGFPQDVCVTLSTPGQPDLVWADYPAGRTYTVKDIFYIKWNGSQWVDADGSGFESSIISDNTSDCSEPVIRNTGVGMTVAWIQNNNVRALTYNGSAWVRLDGNPAPSLNCITGLPVTGTISSLKMALFNNDPLSPFIVFQMDRSGGSDIYLLKWNAAAGAWTDIDGFGTLNARISSGSGYSKGPGIDFDAYSNACVSWFSDDGVHFVRYSGSQWTDADGIGRAEEIIAEPGRTLMTTSLAMYPDGHPGVAWASDLTGSEQDINYLQYVCPFNQPTITPTITQTVTVTVTHTVTPQFTPTSTVTVSPTMTQRPTELKIMKMAEGENPRPGSLIEYNITVKNEDSFPADNINIWDTLPPNTAYEGNISNPAPLVSGNYLLWSFPSETLLPGQQMSVAFTARVEYLRSDSLVINRASCDWHDGYYVLSPHPPVESEASYFPEGAVRVYPNPYGTGSAADGNIKFINAVPGSVIKIYTVSGELVSSLFAETIVVKWNVKNRYGRTVSPGIYYYIADNPRSHEMVKGKIFILK